ncbi:MAG TPA: hypothetical protein VK897_13875 [Anaerolineales bacterium]|nr:hypothetical protein [Anaerolineales bacterium]
MDEIKAYTIDEAHKYFAQSTNSRVWDLLQKPNRSQAEDDEMLHAAHACAYHWQFAGTAVHQQRAEWLISHVHVVLGHGNQALRHAQRCFELTEANRDLMQDFDIAYAFEGMARAQALLGDHKIAEEFLVLAQQAGNGIANEEDRSIFMGDFDGGEWYGLR